MSATTVLFLFLIASAIHRRAPRPRAIDVNMLRETDGVNTLREMDGTWDNAQRPGTPWTQV
eukprot:2010305-Prymnesium_polylepis.1